MTDIKTIDDTLPYERFESYGASALTDAELLAIIIRTGSKDMSSLDIAKKILSMGHGKEKGLNSLFSLGISELKSVNGIGSVKAVKLKCIAELTKRMSSQKAEISLNCTEPSVIAEYYMERLRHEEREKALLLCLNSQLRLIDESVLSIGCVSSAYVSPRDVFMHAVRAGAAAIILLHNHPGGNPHPSKSDVEITNKIRQSGNMLGIILQDHIIIGDKSYYSFAREGLMWY